MKLINPFFLFRNGIVNRAPSEGICISHLCIQCKVVAYKLQMKCHKNVIIFWRKKLVPCIVAMTSEVCWNRYIMELPYHLKLQNTFMLCDQAKWVRTHNINFEIYSSHSKGEIASVLLFIVLQNYILIWDYLHTCF